MLPICLCRRIIPYVISVLSLTTFAQNSGAAQDADDSTSGPVWYGTMDVGVREFRFAIEESTSATGDPIRHLISFDEGAQKFLLDPFVLNSESLQFSLKQTKAQYHGTRSRADDQDLITGKWKQSGVEFDLSFRLMPKPLHQQPDEVWTGEIDPLFQKLALQFRVFNSKEGPEKVLFDSVTQSAGGFHAQRTIEAENWKIEVPALKGSFSGTVNSEGTEVKGKWAQGGLNLDLTLQRQQSARVAEAIPRPRPQTPAAPFPYEIRNVSFSNSADDVILSGTLTIPKQDDLQATAILISGSGPQDRDETLLEHKPFWVIADHLSRNGIAVLRFDDRGVGQSTGNFDEATSEHFARDVEAAMTFVQELPNLQGKPVGLIGHSEGGIIAPMVAVRRPETAFIVMLAGTGVNGRRILETQGQLVLQAEGVTDPQQLLLQRTLQSELLDFVLSENDSEPLVDQSARIQQLTAELRKSITATEMSDEVLQEALVGGLKRLQTPWFRFFLTHEPAQVLSQVKCPVLALNGQKDVQVDSGLNLAAIKAALESGGNSNFEIVEFPGLNHLFQSCETGGVSEYVEIEETIAPQVLNKIADWIRSSSAAAR